VQSTNAAELLAQIRVHGAVPRHVAIIMDGNCRWARERRMPRPFGHRSGMRAVREVVEGAVEVGLDVLKKLLKDHKVGEDEEKRSAEQVQKATDEAIADIDKMLATKEKEILTV